ncbi:serine protease 53-like [Vespa mandarinia]|uniref:serine protease 53-like n=1 Tax=Vespa mandarinia TaxID=7446 RepID=UPI00160CA056|nr:serine protease 53-like [Vespa mandarinia]
MSRNFLIIFAALFTGCFGFYLKHSLFLDNRIVGGQSVSILDHPYQASLLFQYEHLCGASVISQKWVITAAHCMQFQPYFYLVSVGSNATKRGIRYAVTRIVSHPMFDPITLNYDVSLLEVEGTIYLSNKVKPIKLTFVEPKYGFMNVTGWGSLKESGDNPNSLQGVSVPIISRVNCQATYNNIANVTEHMICAGFENGGRDSCQGDSGGPLTANGTLYGIVSWGFGCARPNYPGVYTNIASLRLWILKMSGRMRYFCVCYHRVFILGEAKKASIKDYPYHVSVQKSGKHICSGALIYESWILTAASCVFNSKTSDIKIRVRSESLIKNGNNLDINNIVIHNQFDKYINVNDIALIRLKMPVMFGQNLQPIGLPENADYFIKDNTTSFVTGWQRKSFQRISIEPELSVISVMTVNQKRCASFMPSYKPLSEKMLCAGNMTKGVETCQGDLGAPLMVDQMLIGILSYGLGCETMLHPGVYTRISNYLEWIASNSGVHY